MITFDTETTGLLKPMRSPLADQPYLVEIGAIKSDSNIEIVDTFSEMFSIPIAIPYIVTKITGIKTSDLNGRRKLIDAYDELRAFFEGEDTWIGHNIMFDFSILKYNLTRIDKVDDFPFPRRLICTANESIFLNGYRLKLAALYELATGEKIKGWHRAVSDAESTFECYKWLRDTHGII